jgi:hypothetical protein
MTDTELVAATHDSNTQAGPVVWILSSGELSEGGNVIGVYATKDLAQDDFLTAAQKIPFGIDKAWKDDDEAVHVQGGCDWVSLEPHAVKTQRELNA